MKHSHYLSHQFEKSHQQVMLKIVLAVALVATFIALPISLTPTSLISQTLQPSKAAEILAYSSMSTNGGEEGKGGSKNPKG